MDYYLFLREFYYKKVDFSSIAHCILELKML